MLEDMEKDFEGIFSLRPVFKYKRVLDLSLCFEFDFLFLLHEGGQEADKLGGGGSKSGGSLASGTLGLEWKRSKLLCVIGRRQRWSTRFDGVGRGVVRF